MPSSPTRRPSAGKAGSLRPEPYVRYHADGTVWAKGEMTDGEMTGHWKWFRKDGTVMRSGSFENGQQVGEWTTYDKNGRVVKVTKMKPKRP